MIPDSRFIRVTWPELSAGDTVSLIAYFEGREYVTGSYRIVDLVSRRLKRAGSGFSFNIGYSCDPDVLLVRRKINPHFRNPG